MPKRKRTNRKQINGIQYSKKKKNLVQNTGLTEKINEDDFLDNTSANMDKEKQHISNLHSFSKHVSDASDMDDDDKSNQIHETSSIIVPEKEILNYSTLLQSRESPSSNESHKCPNNSALKMNSNDSTRLATPITVVNECRSKTSPLRINEKDKHLSTTQRHIFT
ncbi:unnamed protein product [Rotaria sp. Silwood1]|nr:unnamed protein product [Rotaria sp. Silwood1]CAF1236496.1 unnamed protein product [Rotaria sp. Silwood1]CAF1399136.1 unnamed protein product [Rotaria sp. Silwood1]CAF1600378.1 unnamed protein product [Rotaria sp. Silwood1]CAF3544683.1 unnamed protein product [Rotaria sp. Silwood1]